MIDYFFDSYALIEIILGNNKYNNYKNCSFVFTSINFAEVYYASLLRDESKAEMIIKSYKDNIVEFSMDILVKAMKFRLKHKKMNLSYADCIGYIYACENNLKFLTGDEKFENMKNVEFVKK